MIYTLYLNNRHGTLIYSRDASNTEELWDTDSALSVNDHIVIASTFHGISGIASQLAPPTLTAAAIRATVARGTTARSPTSTDQPPHHVPAASTSTENPNRRLAEGMASLFRGGAVNSQSSITNTSQKKDDNKKGTTAQPLPKPAEALSDTGDTLLSNPLALGKILMPRGITEITGENIKIVGYETLAGLRMFVTAAPTESFSNLSQMLISVYQIYTQLVLKNPLCDIDMPIRQSNFDVEIDKLLFAYSSMTGGGALV